MLRAIRGWVVAVIVLVGVVALAGCEGVRRVRSSELGERS